MRKIKLFLFIGIVLSIFSCKRERVLNHMRFKNEFNQVEDSIIVVAEKLKLIPKRTDQNNKNYKIRNDSLFVNGKIFVDHLKYLKKFEAAAKFLDKNFISGAYYDQYYDCWMFHYRKSADTDFDHSRDIFLTDSISDLMLRDFNVLEKKGRLTLASPKDLSTD